MSVTHQLFLIYITSLIATTTIDHNKGSMSEDELYDIDSGGEEEDVDLEQSPHERQLASLQTFINSVPYECESVEEMQAKLEDIIGKIIICAEAKNWLTLSAWDGVLQW